MKKYFLLFLFPIAFVFSQNFIQIQGNAVSATDQKPLESATVYLQTKKDSSLVDYTSTDKNGKFSLKIKANQPPTVLKISYVGFKTYRKELNDYSKNIVLGNLLMEEISSELDEVVVKADVAPIKFKKDTLEFNASSFKVAPDANVMQLLKQLPGVEIDENGKITVNGKEVNNVLVNGKPLFGSDGKIAIQNLPAEIINKVQITTTKTKEEELAKEDASGNEATINLTIDEDKNKGLIGRITAGYGTNERYEASGLVNSFKGDRRFSILASSNNINSTGFSMDEVFDNMNGGRNYNMWSNSDGSFGINDMQFGGNKGIVRTNMLGISYSDEWLKKKLSPIYTVLYNNNEIVNENQSQIVRFLPNATTTTNATSNNISKVDNYNFSQDYNIKLDSTSTLNVAPRFSKSIQLNNRNYEAATFNENADLLNRNKNTSSTTNLNTSFFNRLNWNKQLKKKGSYISFQNEVSINETDNQQLFKSLTEFIATGAPNDERDQKVSSTSRRTNVNFSGNYSTPISDSASIGIQLSYSQSKQKDALRTLDFDGVNYANLNEFQSNNFASLDERFRTSATFRLRKKKTRGAISAGTQWINNQNEGLYLGENYQENRRFLYPSFNTWLSSDVGKNKSIYFYGSYNVNLPSARQLLAITDLSNPLNTIVGNTDLKPTEVFNIYFNYNNYDYAKKSGIYFYGGGDAIKNSIVNFTVFDDNFKATTSYQNIDWNYNAFMGGNWSKSFSKEKNKYRISLGTSMNYNFNKGFINNEMFTSSTWSITPRLYTNWNVEKMFSISPFYEYTYSKGNYTNYVIESISNQLHKVAVETTTYWPKNILFGNDFSYNYNSNIAEGFRRNFYLWNTSLGYEFYQKKLVAKVKVYDLLNQNLSNSRNITPTGITDAEDLILRRYTMFSLTYKFDKFGTKKGEEESFFDEE